MKLIASLVCGACLLAKAALAESRVSVTLGPGPAGAAIPADFLGLSFGTRTMLPDKAGAYFFTASNSDLVTLFRNLGLRHLRVGGTSVESPPKTRIPDEREIDSLFAFARAAGVSKVIYSFRLLETNAEEHVAATDAKLAKYIWDHYRSQLDCFAVGNEPDRQTIFQQDFAITNFATYYQKWKQFVAAITNVVPDARFTGPDAGSGNVTWTTRFADLAKDSGNIAAIAEHFYVGGAGRGVSAQQGIEAILSPSWLAANERLYTKMAQPVLKDGLSYRFTEANDHYSGGVRDASDTYAGALWALDFLHWWAAHDTRGVDFHNTHWVANDVITPDANGRLTINPKGYGLKAFELGSHGSLQPITLSNPDGLNLTAYAVRGKAEVYVTLINKEHGSGGRAANVILPASGAGAGAQVIFLAAANGDPAVKTGVTLGGAPITANGPWLGKWGPLKANQIGQYTVKLPAASAAVARLPAL